MDKPSEHRLYKTLIMMSVVVYNTARIETHCNKRTTGRKGEGSELFRLSRKGVEGFSYHGLE